MRAQKERVTITVDRALVQAGSAAVAAGRAASLSGWINLALEERVAKEQRLVALADAIAHYEKKHGAISQAELSAQARADRTAAVVIRGGKRPRRKGRSRAA